MGVVRYVTVNGVRVEDATGYLVWCKEDDLIIVVRPFQETSEMPRTNGTYEKIPFTTAKDFKDYQQARRDGVIELLPTWCAMLGILRDVEKGRVMDKDSVNRVIKEAEALKI